MKKKIVLCLTSAVMLFIAFLDGTSIQASEFEGKEDYYLNLCRQTNLSAEQKQECSRFSTYYNDQYLKAQDELNKINNEINAIKGNLNKLMSQINSFNNQVAQLQKEVNSLQKASEEVKRNKEILEKEIKKKEKDIKKRDDQIKDRIFSMQPTVSTNMYVDFLMGANDLVDLIRRAEGLEQMTQYDQEQIRKLQEDKRKLEADKKELIRQQEVLDEQMKFLDERMSYMNSVTAKNKELISAFQLQEAEMVQKQRESQANLQVIQNVVNQIDWGNLNLPNSTGFIKPINPGSYWISAGTWYYPGGGVHIGLDLAANRHTQIKAPINAVVLYASNACPSASTGLGDGCGAAAGLWGGGNFVVLVGSVNGRTYAINLYHMTKDVPAVNYIGKTVYQGQVIGHVGTSGNSTGEHLHYELRYLGNKTLQQIVDEFKRNGDFSFGTRYNLSRTCSATGGVAPCVERPEYFM